MEKNNKGLITFLVGVIVVLVVLCILFAMNVISFDKKDTDSKIEEKLVGTYTYKGEYYDRERNASGEGFNETDAYALGKMTYEVLTLNADGSAIMSYSNARGSGSNGSGKWSISGDKISVNNEKCTDGGNCQKVWEYSYFESNKGIEIKSSNNNVAIVYLKKSDSNDKDIDFKMTLGDVSINLNGVNTKLSLDGTLDLSYDSNKYLGASISGYCLGNNNEKYLIHGPGDGATLYYNGNDIKLMFTENVPQNVEYTDGTVKDISQVDWNNVKIKYCKVDKIVLISNDNNNNLEKEVKIEKNFN